MTTMQYTTSDSWKVIGKVLCYNYLPIEFGRMDDKESGTRTTNLVCPACNYVLYLGTSDLGERIVCYH